MIKSFIMHEKNLQNMPPLNALRTFNVAAQCESFSTAARRLNVTHTAVSHQIAKLEDWLGTDLFRKEGRAVRLTQTGIALKLRTSHVFDELLDIGRDFQVHGRRDSLIVGCIPSIATRWLVPNLRDFTSGHPDLDVQVLYADMRDQLMESIYDVLITYIPQKSQDVVEIPMIPRKTHAVCSQNFLDRYGPFDRPEDLLQTDLLHDETRDGWREWFEAAGITLHEPMKGTMFQDFNLLVISAIAGHGAALCPIEAFRDEIRRGDLIRLFPIATNSDKYYNLYTRKRAPKSVAVFAQWFRDVCGM
jgi:LysR family glycine cleavage system transcriptional activator